MWYSLYTNTNEAYYWPDAYRNNNANNIAYFFTQEGWTINAICAMLGNMQIESLLNPAQWEIGYSIEGDVHHGYGLVQWTPWDKYTNWAEAQGYDWRHDFDAQLQRIKYELENGEQWDVAFHGMTFYEFTRSTETVAYLTEAWVRCYEKPGDPTASLSLRIANASHWYEFFTGHPPTPPTPEPGAGNKFKLMFYLKPKWKRGIY